MNLEDNNINGVIAEKRDIFLAAEKEYLEELKKVPANRELIKDFNRRSATDLSREAEKRINSIENGEIKQAELERVEWEIVLLYASIQDKIRERVREKIYEKPTVKRKDEDEFER